MSEEAKKTAPAQEAEQPETAPEEKAQQAAPEQEPAAEAADPKDDKKKDGGWFNKKARELEAVKAKLDAAEANAAQAKDQLLRMAAEYENYRKRSTREADQKFNDGISFAVNQIIPILDTLEMAANAPTTDENYKKGVTMTLDKAAKALDALHVEEIEALGSRSPPRTDRRAAPSSRSTRRATSWAIRSSAMRPLWWPNNKAETRKGFEYNIRLQTFEHHINNTICSFERSFHYE